MSTISPVVLMEQSGDNIVHGQIAFAHHAVFDLAASKTESLICT